MAVESHRGGRFQLLAIEGGENADNIVGARRRLYNSGADDESVIQYLGSSREYSLLIDGFHKLTDDQRDALYSLDLFLRPHELALQRSGGIVSFWIH